MIQTRRDCAVAMSATRGRKRVERVLILSLATDVDRRRRIAAGSRNRRHLSGHSVDASHIAQRSQWNADEPQNENKTNGSPRRLGYVHGDSSKCHHNTRKWQHDTQTGKEAISPWSGQPFAQGIPGLWWRWRVLAKQAHCRLIDVSTSGASSFPEML